MRIWKNKLSKLTDYTSTSFKPTMKKIAVTSFAYAALMMGIGTTASAADHSKLTTVYYVYLNKEYIGTVSNKGLIEDLVNEKLNNVQKSFDHFDIMLGSKLTYISEQVIGSTPKTEDKEVLEILEEELSVEAEASALVIDDAPVTYLENHEVAEKVIETIKLKYVSKDELKEVEALKEDPKHTLPPLNKNETRILDVRLSKNVSVTEGKVSPKEILSHDEAVKLLTKGTLEEKKYQVKEGDVLGKIASAHDMKLNQLLEINPELKEDSVLKIDQELNVTFLEPLVRVIVEREVLEEESMPYEKEVIEDSSMFKGDTKVKQEGKDGLREVTYKISEQNGVKVKQKTIKEKVIEKPVDHIVIKGTKVIPSRGDGNFVWPTNGGYVSSHLGYRWGKMHKGIDIARPSNLTIKTVDNGIVVSAGWDGGYGNKVVIDHQNGFRTVYAHLSSISVKPGQTVVKGSQIGVMGSTGDSTGVHLHFEVYKNGSLKNPLEYLR